MPAVDTGISLYCRLSFLEYSLTKTEQKEHCETENNHGIKNFRLKKRGLKAHNTNVITQKNRLMLHLKPIKFN